MGFKEILKRKLISMNVVSELRGASWIRSLILEHKRTMVSHKRLLKLEENCLLAAGLEGAFVECGVGQGGCLVLMAYLAREKMVWGFDSFEGMPELTEEDEGDGEQWVDFACSGDRGIDAVYETFRMAGVGMKNVCLQKGWFEETLRETRKDIGPIALLRLDNDFYQSTKYCLNTLYDLVVEGGVIIIDDYYSFKGCQKAVDEFRAQEAIEAELVVTHDNSEVYWVKEV